MLVLTRKSQQSVVIGAPAGVEGRLKVTVLRVEGGQVRLGFEGAPQMPVHRFELWERIRAGGGDERPRDNVRVPSVLRPCLRRRPAVAFATAAPSCEVEPLKGDRPCCGPS